MLHNKTTFGSRNASEGRFCVLHTVLIGLNDKFNEKVITYVRIKVIKGIVSQHIMQKGTNMDDMEKTIDNQGYSGTFADREEQGVSTYKN